MDIVAVRDGVLDPLEHDNGDAIGKDRPTRIGVERPRMPVLRQNAALGEVITALVQPIEGNGAGQRHVAFARHKLWNARWTATVEVEHAHCTVMLGPRSPSLYEARVAR